MQVDHGLEKTIAAETALSHVDGLAGELIICGYRLDDLVAQSNFDHVAALLLGEEIVPAEKVTSLLGAARVRVTEQIAPLLPHLARLDTFDAMRTAIATLPDDSTAQTALDMVVAPGTILAHLLALRANTSPQSPDPAASHAHDMLRLAGLSHDGKSIAALNAYLISVVDHGLNASTFTARVVASTEAGLMSSTLAALGALKGPLHGGAPGPVLDMLDAIGTEDNARPWIERELLAGRRLMGFGHRIYRVRDPRADALKAALKSLHSHRLGLAATVEREALAALAIHKPARKLDTNVEFYTAVLLETLGFPRDCFTAVFAAGRATGWVAHAREQAATGRLIRPQSRYVGPAPKRAA